MKLPTARLAWVFAWIALCGQALAADGPSARVETVALVRRALPEVVSGYGVVTPDTDSLQTLSLPRAGQVLRLRVAAGEPVRQGQVLLEFGNSADAELGFRQARQALDYARGERARVAALLGQQLATRSQLAAADKAVADAEAALQMQQGIGADRSRQAVVAPFDGLVAAVSVAQGDRVAAGAPLLQLARQGRQHLLMGVEPGDARTVRAGMPVSVAAVVDATHPVRGRVTQVFGMVNPQTQLVDVRVELASGALLAGTRVSATIDIARPAGWVVPRSAVLRDAHGAYLFQVRQGKAHRVDVRTGIEQGGQVAVQPAAPGQTLDPALPVVSLGNYELQDGMAVRGATK
ncbi:MAG: efflux RND transporter periplasmic adaptor subunit [Burkholderiales bacterium]|nr:efflux RND transporter periplasmic adaptor subunit [Burkholderiales bacterium]